jgi:hypothetical protein
VVAAHYTADMITRSFRKITQYIELVLDLKYSFCYNRKNDNNDEPHRLSAEVITMVVMKEVIQLSFPS